MRLALHQEKISNKRLALKLDQTEATLLNTTSGLNPVPTSGPVETSGNESEKSPIKEKDLNIKTLPIGHVTQKELEISLNQMKRKNKNLEEKIITLHKQLKGILNYN